MEQRRTGVGQTVIGVRLADGSTREVPSGPTQKHLFDTMQLTLFCQRNAELDDFKQHVGSSPLLFMCLHGMVAKHGVEVRTVKYQLFWRVAVGAKCDDI